MEECVASTDEKMTVTIVALVTFLRLTTEEIGDERMMAKYKMNQKKETKKKRMMKCD